MSTTDVITGEEQATSQEAAAPDADPETKAKAKAPKKTAAAEEPMRAFKCSQDEYVARAMADFPLPAKALYNFALGVVHVFCAVFYPTTYIGEGEFVAHVQERGSVIVMNHVSMVEPVCFITRMWTHGIKVRPIYKREFDRIRPARWFFSRLGGIPIERGTADLKALRSAKNALKRGECVIVYPEGTRIKDDDQPVEIHGGFAMIAQMAGTDVVPSAVVGAADPYKTRPTRLKRPVIEIGAPISFSELGVKGRKAQVAEMERVAMERVYALRDALRDAHPGLW